MEVRTCKGCKRLFNYIGGQPLCPKCLSDLEDKFQEVKKYVEDNPAASLSKVAEDNEISPNQIKQWIREERLSFSKESIVGIECESCGKLIKTGRFCDECKLKLHNDFGSVTKKEESVVQKKQREAARMRFLDNAR